MTQDPNVNTVVFKNGPHLQYQQFASASAQAHLVTDGEDAQGGQSKPNAPPSHQAAIHHYTSQNHPGGSFDSNLRIKEIRERNIAGNKPASKVGFRSKGLQGNAL